MVLRISGLSISMISEIRRWEGKTRGHYRYHYIQPLGMYSGIAVEDWIFWKRQESTDCGD